MTKVMATEFLPLNIWVNQIAVRDDDPSVFLR